mmetsp:Transcript_31595/g.76330  ORF Transcript_31595/g.76330 Transcript_31595/m.76330 type:complete len:534 (-) Transcript_31595:28-1629(-)
MSSPESEGKEQRRCCAKWCHVKAYLPHRVPRIAKPKGAEGGNDMTDKEVAKLESKRDKLRIKEFIRNEIRERLGLQRVPPKSKEYADLRYCKDHKFEIVTGKSTTRKLADGSTKTIRIPAFKAPIGTGGKGFQTPTKTVNKGVSSDRKLYRHVVETKAYNELGYALQQSHEMEDITSRKQSLDDISPRLVQAAGLDVHCGVTEAAPENMQLDETARSKMEKETCPCIKPNDLTTSEVKRRTGIQDLSKLLSYVMVVCGGSLEELFATSSKMTWLEEWLFYLELKYGRTAGRWQDIERMYKCRVKTLRRVLKRKLSLELGTRKRWPMYASYEEDARFRNRSWDSSFDPLNGERIIMHDATGIPLQRPSSAEQQRALYSDYYGTTCAKGGISNQLCGWIRGIPLFTGRISDSQMIKDSKVLVEQRTFSEADASSDEPFTNVFDKGFRNSLDAAMEGQKCKQPKYSKGDIQFSGNDTLYSACVAVVRSGNERAVQRCKMSWFLKRGCAFQQWDIGLFCDIWEAWTFQVNFMYDKFL